MAFDIARETIEAYQNRRAAEEYEKRMTETRTRRRR
jgi:hypothetical protein